MIAAVLSRILLWFWVVPICATPVFAQKTVPSPATWALTFHGDLPLATPTAQIKSFMEGNGLSGSYTGFFGTAVYPVAKAATGIGLRLELFRPRVHIGGDFQFVSGRVDGSKDVIVRWQAFSLAPLYSHYSPNRAGRISIGPSIEWIQTEAGTNLFRSTGLHLLPLVGLAKQTRVVPGLVIDAGLRFPTRSLFFAELGGRYEAAFGQVHNELKFDTGYALPINVNFNRFMFTIGIGCRFGG